MFEDANDHHMYHGLPYDSKDAPIKALDDKKDVKKNENKHWIKN